MATAGYWMVGPGCRRPHVRRAGYGASEKERTHWISLAPRRACPHTAPHALVFRTSLPRPPCHLACHLQAPLLANEGEGDSGKRQTSPADHQMIQGKEKHPLVTCSEVGFIVSHFELRCMECTVGPILSFPKLSRFFTYTLRVFLVFLFCFVF